MLIYKPTKEVFETRKEIKQKYGIKQYRKMLKDGEIIFVNNRVAIDDETIYSHFKRDSIIQG